MGLIAAKGAMMNTIRCDICEKKQYPWRDEDSKKAKAARLRTLNKHREMCVRYYVGQEKQKDKERRSWLKKMKKQGVGYADSDEWSGRLSPERGDLI